MDVMRRKELKQKVSNLEIPSSESIVEALPTDIRSTRVSELKRLASTESSVLDETALFTEIASWVEEIKTGYQKNQLDELIAQMKNTSISALIGPFGLGPLFFKDKAGGNVTTIHNAKVGIYANADDKYDRRKYDSTKNSEGKTFRGAGRNSVGSQYTRSKMDVSGYVHDEYTGKVEKASNTSPDHGYAISKYHMNGGYMQSETKKADFATDKDNLFVTNRAINQSMKDDDKKEWARKKQSGRDVTNEEYYNIDSEKLNEAYRKGSTAAERHLPSNGEKVKYYAKEVTTSGLKEGFKFGTQQAIGLLIIEFIDGVSYEIKDIYKNGFNPDKDSFFQVLKFRGNRLIAKIVDKRKEVVSTFAEGAVSGFFSNLLTTIINMAKTTSAKAVRAIREGFFSIFRATKIMLNPPENLTKNEAYHEATKILSTGSIIAMGTFLDEIIEKAILSIPVIGQILIPLANIIANVIAGIITGIVSALVVYFIDKIDLFSVNEDKMHSVLSSFLENLAQEKIDNLRNRYGYMTTVEF